MQVTVHAAKTNLSKLIEAALKGEEVIIARGDRPVVRLVPVEKRNRFKFDTMADRLTGQGPDFFEPLDDSDISLWEGGGADRL
ncbi:type II toxin-antitoxin system Phd/YefM family antitoxin [Lichenihabitans psoromatis]|uniref:type II toxin-antitoxin system Phd/YefM family antitoxin n=1 Tax=Lichenihabitans psoromatis TaxID=2528642 RepID=UPI001036CBE4|nr:type II toxin-antitoxin system prevent-host-death family antitoxin [Lichenihabitans psoromatis]